MDYRLEALLGVVGVAILFVPVFLAGFVSVQIQEQKKAARERRIADYRQSPASRLLILNDTGRF